MPIDTESVTVTFGLKIQDAPGFRWGSNHKRCVALRYKMKTHSLLKAMQTG
jgi:hypothetical protein